uniref:Armadillo-like helical domain-containing protein n=1 Tax=Plectus sambesii TaxID=2011161 RepID=A0A914XIT5_9BILA
MDRKELKQKVLLFYDQLFSKNEDPAKTNPNFWNEFFLLWTNQAKLEECVGRLSGQQLLRLKPVFNILTSQCVTVVQEEHNIKAVNAIQTLIAVVRGLARRGGVGFDVIDILFGFDVAEEQMKKLIERLCEFLMHEEHPNVLKKLSLDAFLSLATVTDKLAENELMRYFLNSNNVVLFDAIVQLLNNSTSRKLHGDSAVLLLTLLINYCKHENQFIAKLSILDDELALHGYSHVISTSLAEHNRFFQNHLSQSESKGMLASVTNMVGTMFVAEDVVLNSVKSDDRLLLAMYEAVHLNRNFITTLTSMPTQVDGTEMSASQDESTNLFVAFLTYCSVVIQDLKSERTRDAAKLCFVILTCIADDQYANGVMHDVNMAFRIPLYRAPMRHRKGAFDKSRPLRPLVVTVLDLLCEFISSHLMRQLPNELFGWALGIVQRIICYEKKCRVRLQYDWRALWNALISLLRFVVQQEAHLVQSFDVFVLCQKVVTILNLFITFGDTFLPDPTTYDHLYYEIIRQRDAFDNLYSLGLF